VTGVAVGVALGVWWTSNTVAHMFIHRAFFRRRLANQVCAAVMSVASGIPQALWRDRHLAHHAGITRRLPVSGEGLLHLALVAGTWSVLIGQAPAFFFSGYLPGYIGGLVLCALHGHYEHAGGTTSHYGKLYNLLTFNDGFHVEHHAHPSLPWHELPARRNPSARASRWPAPLRWLESVASQRRHRRMSPRNDNPAAADTQEQEEKSCRVSGLSLRVLGVLPGHSPASRCLVTGLEVLERVVLRSHLLQRFVLRTHEQALADLLEQLPHLRTIAIVGGGLFPRTALALRRLRPSACLTVIDANPTNLARARAWIGADAARFVHARVAGSEWGSEFDLVIIPLAFVGDRAAVYANPPAPAVIVHDWLWRRVGTSRIVSIGLLKRMNLVRR
jgi:hypothetical protein